MTVRGGPAHARRQIRAFAKAGELPGSRAVEVEPEATRRHKVALRPAASPDIQDAVTDRELLDLIDRTLWIADSLTLFDFEVARAANGQI